MKILPFKRRTATQDQHSFETLLRPYMDGLYRLAYRFCGNREDAEDLVQDLLIKLYPRSKELRAVDELKPWLSKVLYRQFIDAKRRQMRSPIVAIEDQQPSATEHTAHNIPNPEQQLRNEQAIGEVQQALDALSEDHRTLIILFELEGYSLPEMAQLLDIPIGTVKSRLHRARAQLKNLLS